MCGAILLIASTQPTLSPAAFWAIERRHQTRYDDASVDRRAKPVVRARHERRCDGNLRLRIHGLAESVADTLLAWRVHARRDVCPLHRTVPGTNSS